MSPWRPLARGLRALVRPARADRDVDEEVAHYLAESAANHETRGLAPEEARRAARLELGSSTNVREQVRSSGWEHMIETVLTDLRYAARGLRNAPGFTAIIVLTLALGLGGVTTIFSAVNPVLFESLPYPEPRRLMVIRELGPDGAFNDGTFGMYRELASRSRTFESIAVFRSWRPTMTGATEPERLEGQRVSHEYFDILRVPPVLGRSFQSGDDSSKVPAAVIVGLKTSRNADLREVGDKFEEFNGFSDDEVLAHLDEIIAMLGKLGTGCEAVGVPLPDEMVNPG